MSRITVPLADVPGAIAESIRNVLIAKGLSFVGPRCGALTDADLERVLREMGRNAAQCLVGLAFDDEDDEVSDTRPCVSEIGGRA